MPDARLQRPEPSEYNPRFAAEIATVPDAEDFAAMLRDQVSDTRRVLDEFGEEHASVRYAPEKWTVREVVGHMSDVERILSCRALRIARSDMTVLPGFDENAYVPAARFETRSLDSVFRELVAVRAATAAFVESLTAEDAARVGNIGSGQMSVRALLYLIAGHERHHVALLRERYLPAMQAAGAR